MDDFFLIEKKIFNAVARFKIPPSPTSQLFSASSSKQKEKGVSSLH